VNYSAIAADETSMIFPYWRATRTAIIRAAAAFILLAGGGVLPAQAQGRLDAVYTISMARIPVGKGVWSADIGNEQYSTAASGTASGILSALVSGEGTLVTRGSVKDGRLLPASFTSKLNSDGEISELRMLLEDGNVRELMSPPLPSDKDRVPVTEAHRRGILDPLSALLIPAAAGGDMLTAEACRRSLPIFDGRRRYDLRLAFKRIDKVKADKGYQGPVVVCAMAFQAVAGHRADSLLMKYFSQGRDMEIWLAPIAGTRVLALFRLSVANIIGDIVIAASQFETFALMQRPAPLPDIRAP
jgi:hypothetical protein